jgi:hypothetical protein
MTFTLSLVLHVPGAGYGRAEEYTERHPSKSESDD